jgi:anti-sigma B factor antagonist
MKMDSQQLEGGITLIRLDGRLDIEGAQTVDQPLTYATSTHAANIAVDLSAVTFLSSIGIRSLLSAARGQATRGGRLVLFGAQPMILRVLQTAGVDQLLTLCDDLDAARRTLEG